MLVKEVEAIKSRADSKEAQEEAWSVQRQRNKGFQYFKGVFKLLKQEFKQILMHKDKMILQIQKENQKLREILQLDLKIGIPTEKDIRDEL